ncbi:hypothetical protein LEN26_000379 [Aphanomyces euteiches]|nr:hypothetical protein AeMF1_016033 [Aphanomyces euteiches]KAH9163640.1 hypothetical protein LEN26_000379 [Aphanomyces euteiches]KAH9195801.1 hypothetical protein AeNC1_002223 [Aphanomyces euteiches]
MVKVYISLGAIFTAATAGTVSDFPVSVVSRMDSSVDPCQDFYEYACGTWYKNTTIPDSFGRTSTMDQMNLDTDEVLAKILESSNDKISAFYKSCMNTDKVEALGTSPLNNTLTAIRQAQSKDEILRVAAEMTTIGIDIFTSFVVGGDDKDATTNSLYGRQAQLPLVEKDYYVDATSWKSIGSNYTDYVTTLFKLAEALINATALDDLKTYVEYRLLHNSAPYLPSEFDTAYWKLFMQKMRGAKVQSPRSLKCSQDAGWLLSDLLGTYYLKEKWSNESSKVALEIVNALTTSFKTGIESSDWLDGWTRTNALNKLSKLTPQIAGPRNPVIFSELEFDSEAYLVNRWKIQRSVVKSNMANVGNTVDKGVWQFEISAQTVNAMYDPIRNRIIIPAAMLQPPFFDVTADPSQNFGAIGMVVGHEITHGFDNSGRMFDGDGNRVLWWSSVTDSAFNLKSQCISQQYGNFTARSEITGNVIGNVAGSLTLRETIADNGGVKASFRAYQEYIKTHESKYTKEAGEKLFFISMAQGWCGKFKDAALQSLLMDVHPPNRFRVFGAL